MPVGITPTTVRKTVEAATENVTRQAREIYPEIKSGIDQLDGKLTNFKTYQKGKNAFQRVLRHPHIEQFLRLLSEWFQKLSVQLSKWAESASIQARGMTQPVHSAAATPAAAVKVQ